MFKINAYEIDCNVEIVSDRAYAMGEFADTRWESKAAAEEKAEELREDVGKVVDASVTYEVVEDYTSIERILDAADARAPKADIVSRHDYVHRETGQKFGAFGIPFSVSRDDLDPGPTYWVFQASDGTTYGNRYDTEQAANDKKEFYRLRARAAFETALGNMTDDEIDRQAAYWLGD